MQQITLSGALITDAFKLKDKNNKDFLRFTLSCASVDNYGRTVFTHYRCTCYIIGFQGLKKGDQVFITGRFTPSIGTDDKGKTYMNLDVMVLSIAGGYRANERKNNAASTNK